MATSNDSGPNSWVWGVGHHELRVVDSRVRRRPASPRKQGFGQVNPSGTGRTIRRGDGRGTAPAADVEDTVGRRDRRRVDHGVTEWFQLAGRNGLER
jgi:hypothetical protein